MPRGFDRRPPVERSLVRSKLRVAVTVAVLVAAVALAAVLVERRRGLHGLLDRALPPERTVTISQPPREVLLAPTFGLVGAAKRPVRLSLSDPRFGKVTVDV